MNRSTKYWGADAIEFNPERWLSSDGIPKAAQEIQGHRHILTFADGPRICLGRHFALAEFKVRHGRHFRNTCADLSVRIGCDVCAHQELPVRI